MIAPLSFLILFTVFLLLGEPGQRFVNFVCPFKGPALDLIVVVVVVFYCFLSLYFIYFLSDLYYFVSSVEFIFCLFFFF